MIKIQADTSIYDLVSAYPDVQRIMIKLGFKDITKPGILQTVGRVMTLKKGASLKKIEWEKIKEAFNKQGYTVE